MTEGQAVHDWVWTYFPWVGHLLSGASVLLAIIGMLPGIAALIALVWYSIQIYESDTVQTWLARRRMRRVMHMQEEIIRIQRELARLNEAAPVVRVDPKVLVEMTPKAPPKNGIG